VREKAGDIANEFASELDQSSRNFVTYAQTQMAEVLSVRLRARAGAICSRLRRRPQRLYRRDSAPRKAGSRRLRSGAAAIQVETRIQLEAAHSELTQKVTTEQETSSGRFQNGMSGAMEAGVAEANQRVQAGFEPC